MPAVIKQVIIPIQSNLAPGASVTSSVVDVEGSETVAINVGITSPNGSVTRKVFFGPTPNNAFALAISDTFAVENNLLRSVPTFGPKFFVVVENHGPTPTKCDAWMYAVRKVP